MAPDDVGLQSLLATGREARLEALAAYLHHLPLDTADHWELLRCLVTDLAALRDCIRAIQGTAEVP